MKAIVSVGEAQISSIVAAYEVGTLTSKVRPAASSRAVFMVPPRATIPCASTEGTNRTLMGCSAEPTAGSGTSVGGAAVGSGGWGGGWGAGGGGGQGAR